MSDRFRELEIPPLVRTKDVVLMATVSSFESMSQPGRHELKQFAELFEPVFRASSMQARRNAVAALSRCPTLPQPVCWFLGGQPIELAALFLTRSAAIDDNTLVAIARTHGGAHARAIASRENLSVKVVDALVALHQGLDPAQGRQAAERPPADTSPRLANREEQLRLQLKSLVYRDTLARSDEDPDTLAETQVALLVRFARLREAREFSVLLSGILGSSLWLANRIMLDLSGQQLATALLAIDTPETDGTFILGQFYPHLKTRIGDMPRAEILWSALDAEDCGERVRAWVRADDYTQGRKPENAPAANINGQTGAKTAATALPAQPIAFGRARGTARR